MVFQNEDKTASLICTKWWYLHLFIYLVINLSIDRSIYFLYEGSCVQWTTLGRKSIPSTPSLPPFFPRGETLIALERRWNKIKITLISISKWKHPVLLYVFIRSEHQQIPEFASLIWWWDHTRPQYSWARQYSWVFLPDQAITLGAFCACNWYSPSKTWALLPSVIKITIFRHHKYVLKLKSYFRKRKADICQKNSTGR